MPTENSADKQVFARRESEVRSYCRSFDTVFTSASGSEMTDANGKTYIRFGQSGSVVDAITDERHLAVLSLKAAHRVDLAVR